MTWIAAHGDGIVLVRRHGGAAVLDEPARMRFRQPVGEDRLAALALTEVVEPTPGELDRWCGWYAGPGRRVLFTQVPERSFGEPMVLVGEGDAVVRAYPVGAGRFLREDGVAVALDEAGLRVGAAESRAGLARFARLTGPVLSRDRAFREREVEFAVGGDTLSATLVTPAGPGPHPAAVAVHGAAGGQRDFCRLLVEPVLDAGVAVLLYDKRGHGRSTGSPAVTVFDQARAAAAGLDRLAGEPDVDAGRLGLVGFSNGMWAVPMVAAGRADVTFVAGIGAPGVSMAESEVHRRTKVLREAGVGAATVEAAARAWRCVFALAGAGPDASVEAELSAALDQLRAAADLDRYEIPDYARENPMLSAVPPADVRRWLPERPDPELGHDPVADYAQVHCPVLLQWGALDTSVPVDVSARRISAAQPGAALRVYPGVEHMLNVAVTGVRGISAEEAMYGFHGFRFAAGVREDLRNWLAALRTR
jgi:uncharacterized protein